MLRHRDLEPNRRVVGARKLGGALVIGAVLVLASCGSGSSAAAARAQAGRSAAATASTGTGHGLVQGTPGPTEPASIQLREIVSEPVGADTVETVAFSPNGSLLAAGAADGTVAIYPLQPSGPADVPRAQKLHGAAVTGLAWSANGTQLASVASDGSGRLSSSATLRVLASLPASPNSYPAVAWSPNGQWLALAIGRGAVQLYHAAGGSALPGAAPARGATPRASGTAGNQQLALPQPAASVPISGFTRALAWLPSSRALLLGDGRGRLYRIDPGSPSALALPALGDHSAVNSLAVSPDSTELAVGFDDGLVLLCDPTTGIAQRTLTRGRSVGALVWAPNSQVLAETSIAFDVSLWNKQGTRLAHLSIGYDMNGISWSPDGQELAAGSDDHTLKVWQVTPAQSASHRGNAAPASYMGR